jgi:hypothetical protein
MPRLASTLALVISLVTLGGCMGSEKGNGISRLDTISEEDKENAKWFKSYYGKNHCFGNWASECADEESAGGSGGGMWTGGVGPSDSGTSN